MLASGLSARQFDDYDYVGDGWTVVAINHGCLVAPTSWNHWVRANDYIGERPIVSTTQTECKEYTKMLNKYGGYLKCGFSITLCASYYALDTFDPDVIGYLGADMNYNPSPDGSTHIYGVGIDIKNNGVPDPDRMANLYGPKAGMSPEEYLTHIYNRFVDVATSDRSRRVVNLSTCEDSRLPYPKALPQTFS